jgi:predicted double-glycine peptidase
MNNRHLRRFAPLLSLFVLNDACCIDLPLPGGSRMSMRVASIREMRYQTTLRQQFDFSCGSAALATLLTHHYDYPVTEQQVFGEMFVRGDQAKIRKEGFSLLDMQRFLAARGFKADGFRLPLQKLIDSKLPAIVLVIDHGYHHFVVIKGARDGRILVGDPSAGTRAMPREAFEALWPGKLLFVIHNNPVSPRFNSAADWRAAPRSPLEQGIDRNNLGTATIAKMGPGDF